MKKTNTATHSNLDESHSPWVKQKKPGKREPTLHDSIYAKFKKRQDFRVVIEDMERAITLGGGKEQEEVFWDDGKIRLYLGGVYQSRGVCEHSSSCTFKIKMNILNSVRKKEGGRGRKKEEREREERTRGRREGRLSLIHI